MIQLRVITNPHGPCGRRRPRPNDRHPFVLPRIEMFSGNQQWDFECKVLGLTSRQRNQIFNLAAGDHDDAYIDAVCRVFDIWRVLETALDQERRGAIAVYLRHYPKAARRIMKGMARQEAQS